MTTKKRNNIYTLSILIILVLAILFSYTILVSGDANEGVKEYWNLTNGNATYFSVNNLASDTPTLCNYNTTSFIGNALYCANEYLVVHSTPILVNGSSDFSVSMWVKPASATASYGLLGMGVSGTLTSFSAYRETNGTVSFNNGQEQRYTLTKLNDTSKFNHLVISYNASNKTLYVYLNGNISSNITFANATNISYTNTFSFKIGSNIIGTSRKFTGSIDEVGMWNRTLLSSEVNSLYNNGGGVEYPFDFIPKPVIKFNSQTPSDLTSSNAFDYGYVNISYNVTGDYNLTSPTIFYKTNSTTTDISYYVNGTAYSGFQNMTSFNDSNPPLINFTMFRFYDGQVYPAIYNRFNMDMLPNTNFHNLTGINDYYLVNFLNISNNKTFGFIEFYGNSTGTNEIYYCNSSYTNGAPSTSSFCSLLSTIQGDAYNHSHLTSSHLLVPFPVNITTRKVGNVGVTPSSLFLIRGTTKLYGQENVSRLNSNQYTTNNGNTWTPINYDLNAHVHQFDTDTQFVYYMQVINNLTNLTVRTNNIIDFLNKTSLPPTTPSIIIPINTTYSGIIPINFNPAVSPNGYTIAYYNIDLHNNNHTIITNIYNGTNTSLNWNSNIVNDGVYHINISAVDSQGQYSYSYSESFSIDNSAPQIVLIEPTPTNFQILSSPNLGIYINLSDATFNNVTYNLYFDSDNLYKTFTYNNLSYYHNFNGLVSGVGYKFNVTACDIFSQCNTTVTRIISYTNQNLSGGGSVTINQTPYLNLSFASLNSCPNSSPQVTLFLGLLFALIIIFGFGYSTKSILLMMTPALAIFGMSFMLFACLEFLGFMMIGFGLIMIPLALSRGRHL